MTASWHGLGSRRFWIGLIIAVVLVAVVIRGADRSTPIFTFRMIDARTLAVATVTGPGTWTRVTSVSETSSSVTIAVGSLSVPLPRAGGDTLELTVSLREPLGDREVIDAASGLPIPSSVGPP